MSASEAEVVIVGAGVVGLSIAVLARHAGLDVTVVDRGGVGGGASRGNAGWVSVAAAEPLTSVAALRELTRAHRAASPLWIHPRFSPRLARFGAEFALSARPARFRAGVVAMASLAGRTEPALAQLAAAGVPDVRSSLGLLTAYRDAPAARRAHAILARQVEETGVGEVAPLLEGDALLALEPMVRGCRAGYVLPGDRHVDPGEVVAGLEAAAGRLGVRMLLHQPGVRVDAAGGRARGVVTDATGVRATRAVIVAAGIGSGRLLRPLGLHLPLQAGKGYSFSVPLPAHSGHAVQLPEPHLAITPLAGRLRIAGTMELSGENVALRPSRIEAMVRGGSALLDGVDWDARSDEWVGCRPLTADGLPVIGRTAALDGLILATGHGMYGLSLAAPTAQAVTDLLLGRPTSVPLAPFAPDRLLRRRRAPRR